MSNKKVAIIGGNPDYATMFEKMGYKTTADVFGADLIQFCGGADVSPFIYGEDVHRTTHADFHRDMKEAGIFAVASRMKIPMAGICRGGQFLNVMCGGRMWQDVDRHAIWGTHEAYDVITGQTVQVTSTHHQMMIKANEGQVVAVARESTIRHADKFKHEGEHEDLEVVWYSKQKALCFQPHPEFREADSTREYYFQLLEKYIWS